MSEPEFIYGYGKAKHILDFRETKHFQRFSETVEIALCGAAGNYPFPNPLRPLCKRCERAYAKKATSPDGASA